MSGSDLKGSNEQQKTFLGGIEIVSNNDADLSALDASTENHIPPRRGEGAPLRTEIFHPPEEEVTDKASNVIYIQVMTTDK